MGTKVYNKFIDEEISRGVNLLDNGGFEIWQRGTSFNQGDGHPRQSDRWTKEKNGAPTYTVTQDSANRDTNSLYCVKLNISALGGCTRWWSVQNMEDVELYRGMTLSFSVRVKTSIANVVQIGFWTNTGGDSFSSQKHSGSGNYETITYTYTIPTNATGRWAVMINLDAPSTGDYYWDNAMLVVGAVPADYIPIDASQELARCQRFYEKGHTCLGGYLRAAGSGRYTRTRTHFSVSKRVVPTVVLTLTSGSNVDELVDHVTIDGFNVIGQVSSGGDAFANEDYDWTADSEM